MQDNSESFSNLREDAPQPSISIVVIGRNEGQRLAACLQSIQQIRGVAVNEVIYRFGLDRWQPGAGSPIRSNGDRGSP